MKLNNIQFTLYQKPTQSFVLSIIDIITVFIASLPLLFIQTILFPQLDIDGIGSRYRICRFFVLLPCVTSPTLLIFELWVGHPDTRKRDFNAHIPSPLYLILWEKYCSHPISSALRVWEALSIVAWFVGEDALLAEEKSSWGGGEIRINIWSWAILWWWEQ